MFVLNFAHPLTAKQIAQITAAVGDLKDIRDVRVQFNIQQPFGPQVVALLDSLGILPAEWQTRDWLVVLPALSSIAGVLLAELYGRTGYFPPILRLKAVTGTINTEYEVAEIIHLDTVQHEARSRQ